MWDKVKTYMKNRTARKKNKYQRLDDDRINNPLAENAATKKASKKAKALKAAAALTELFTDCPTYEESFLKGDATCDVNAFATISLQFGFKVRVKFKWWKLKVKLKELSAYAGAVARIGGSIGCKFSKDK